MPFFDTVKPDPNLASAFDCESYEGEYLKQEECSHLLMSVAKAQNPNATKNCIKFLAKKLNCSKFIVLLNKLYKEPQDKFFVALTADLSDVIEQLLQNKNFIWKDINFQFLLSEKIEKCDPLQAAAIHGHSKVLKLLCDHRDGVSLLKDSKAEVVSCDGKTRSLLHYLIVKDDLDSIKLLCEIGKGFINVNTLSTYSWRDGYKSGNRTYPVFCPVSEGAALHYAIHENRKEIVRYLYTRSDVDLGCLTSIGDCNWYKGKQIYSYYSQGNTVLHVACHYQRDEIINELCKHSKIHEIVNAKNEDGDTAFHLVKNFTAGKILIEKSDLLIRNNKGKTAFEVFCEKEIAELVNYMVNWFLDNIEWLEHSVGENYLVYLYRAFGLLDADTKERLIAQSKIEQESMQVISEEPKVSWACPQHIVYTSNNPSDEIKKRKTCSLDVEPIHTYLAQQHKEIRQKHLSDHPRAKTNFIFAAISFLTTDREHESGGGHKRRWITFAISGDIQCYSNENQNRFLQNMVTRCFTVGAYNDKTQNFLKYIHEKDIISLNENGEPESSGFHFRYMHSEQALLDFLNLTQTQQSIVDKLTEIGIDEGFKVYALALHIYSTNSLCANLCKESIFGFQNSHRNLNGFLFLLRKKLLDEGYKVPKKEKTPLKMITYYNAKLRHYSEKPEQKNLQLHQIELNDKSSANTVLVCQIINDSKMESTEFELPSLGQQRYSFFVSGEKYIPVQLEQKDEAVSKKRSRSLELSNYINKKNSNGDDVSYSSNSKRQKTTDDSAFVPTNSR